MKSMAIRCQLGHLWVGRRAVEHVSDGLAFRGRKACHIDQGFDSLTSGRSDDCTGVGVTDEHESPLDSLRCPIERRYIVRQGRQR